jgi:hypothetical protein
VLGAVLRELVVALEQAPGLGRVIRIRRWRTSTAAPRGRPSTGCSGGAATCRSIPPRASAPLGGAGRSGTGTRARAAAPRAGEGPGPPTTTAGPSAAWRRIAATFIGRGRAGGGNMLLFEFPEGTLKRGATRPRASSGSVVQLFAIARRLRGGRDERRVRGGERPPKRAPPRRSTRRVDAPIASQRKERRDESAHRI